MKKWLKLLALGVLLEQVEKLKRTMRIAGIVMGVISVGGFTALLLTRDNGPADKKKISKKIMKLLLQLTPEEQNEVVDELNKQQPVKDSSESGGNDNERKDSARNPS